MLLLTKPQTRAGEEKARSSTNGNPAARPPAITPLWAAACHVIAQQAGVTVVAGDHGVHRCPSETRGVSATPQHKVEADVELRAPLAAKWDLQSARRDR